MEIVSTFVTALGDFCSGIATAVVDTFEKVCLTADGGLSNLAIWGITFGAITLAVGVVRSFTRKAG